MSEELSLAARYALQPVDGSCLVPAQGLELPISPSCQEDVDVPQGRVESRRVELPIEVDPSADVYIEHPRQIIQRLVAAFVQGPASDCLANLLERLVAGCRAERDTNLPSPPSRQPRPEGVAEKIELMVGMLKTSTVKRHVHSLFRQGCMLYDLLPTMRDDWLGPLMQRFSQMLRDQPLFADVFGPV